MEYIGTLITSNAVSVVSEQINDVQDFVTKGVKFVDKTAIIVINVPTPGAIVRDVKVPSQNVAQISVTLTTDKGVTLTPITGKPTDLPKNQFPTEKVTKIVIEILQTTDNQSPKGVTLSVVACAPGITTGTTQGKASLARSPHVEY
jgi:hypothetical protein